MFEIIFFYDIIVTLSNILSHLQNKNEKKKTSHKYFVSIKNYRLLLVLLKYSENYLPVNENAWALVLTANQSTIFRLHFVRMYFTLF